MKTINNWFSAIYVTTCLMTSLCIAACVLLSYILKDTTAMKKSMAPGLEITLFVIAAALIIGIIWWNVGLAVKGFMAFCIVGCICWISALHDYIEIPPDIDPDTMEPVKSLR